MTFKASWGRCSMGQTISVHTACLMIVPLHLMNSMGENCVCFVCLPCVIYSLLCVICFSLSFSLICFSSDLLSIVLSLC